MRGARRAWLGVLGVALALGTAAPAAQGAFNDPLFVMRPVPPPPRPPAPRIPPPAGELEGPCGIAVDDAGRLYVSDYYHDTIDIFGDDPVLETEIGPAYPYGYLSQITNVDPLDGPCALALDGAGNIYANDLHRAALKVSPPSVFAGAPKEEGVHPTGIAVDPLSERLYVNERNRVAVFDLAGTEVGALGVGHLGEGYGLAVSRFPASAGDVYVADAEDNTLEVFAPGALPGDPPAATIDGSATPPGRFVSLRDAAVAVDDATGEIYVTDNLQPDDTERPEAVVYAFSAAGTYEGRLKYSVVFGLPLGLAVDNSPTPSQGRVYVSSSNTSPGAIYAYPPHAASAAAVALPEPFELGGVADGSATDSSAATGDVALSAWAGSSPVALAAPAPASSSASAPVAGPRERKGKAHRPRHRHHRRQRSAR